MEIKTIEQQNWYVVYTYPNTEKRICNDLTRRQITSFLPIQKVVRQWSDRKKQLEVPLFPSYVFVKIHSKDMWMVTMVDGVARFVSFNGTPAIVKESEVDVIKKIISGARSIRNESNCLTEGDYVQIKNGPLTGLEGRGVCKQGNTRLYHNLTSINKMISVAIDADNLSKITNHALITHSDIARQAQSTSF